MSLQKRIEAVYEQADAGNLPASVRASFRLARIANDLMGTAYFARILRFQKAEFDRLLAPLVDDAEQLEWLSRVSLSRYLDLVSIPGDFQQALLPVLGDFEKIEVLRLSPDELAQSLASIDYRKDKSDGIFNSLHRLIASRMIETCHSYAIGIERALAQAERDTSFLNGIEGQVESFYSLHAPNVAEWLVKARSILKRSQGDKDNSLAATSIRRAMLELADFCFPPQEGKIRCLDGTERLMGKDQFTNRLHEFVTVNLDKSGSRDLLKTEIDLVGVYVRRLNEISSKGVHNPIPTYECDQALASLYMLSFQLARAYALKHLPDDQPNEERRSSASTGGR
ncbi:hypothetical protein OIU34_18500 [Pararhizobium sp. BT-229]|uniref:hypothetical protein n=1 Tax=Pararhizobium sp. BT-229 TaxID=2986923 RepID=UPI0021F6CD4D|nr:hypothetical protein [Pararhizobium sp. BT-229]MCV9963870.1 hypothetical protein [Pararhizobium sp. BT-229]